MKDTNKFGKDRLSTTEMETIISKHNQGPGGLIPTLQEVQEKNGFLSKNAIMQIAKSMKIYPSTVYGVATFYTQFRLSPQGKHIIKVCKGTACHVGGAQLISDIIEEELGIVDGETTEDGLFTVEEVACLGCCSLAPVMMIGDEVFGKLTEKKIKKVLKEYKSDEGK